MTAQIDAAVLGEVPPPVELERFLLATGERGIGYAAVYGTTPLTVRQYNLLTYLQRRALQAATEEGRTALQRERAVTRAAALEAVLQATRAEQVFGNLPPLDPETMTAQEVADWMARYNTGFTSS